MKWMIPRKVKKMGSYSVFHKSDLFIYYEFTEPGAQFLKLTSWGFWEVGSLRKRKYLHSVYKRLLHTDCFVTPKKYFCSESKAQVLPIKKYTVECISPSKASEITLLSQTGDSGILY